MSNISPPQSPGRQASPPGWHPDPSGRHEFRYWDGAAWTYAVSDAGARSDDVWDGRADVTGASRRRSHDEAHEADGRSSSRGGFWSGLTGMITAIAAVITAAGGLFFATSGGNDDAPLNTDGLIVVAEGLGVDDTDPGAGAGSETGAEPSPEYTDYVRVADDTETIVVEVPAEWTEVDGRQLQLENGTYIPDVMASSDLDAFLTDSAPGVEVSATDLSVADVPTAMDELARTECTLADSQPYDDPAFEGRIDFFTDCPGTDAIYVLLAASYKPEPERIAIVQAVLMTDTDVDAMIHVLDTFNFA
jgi:Protein of unknown function (DUF2510)